MLSEIENMTCMTHMEFKINKNLSKKRSDLQLQGRWGLTVGCRNWMVTKAQT